jgi:hypothetical protein
MTRSICACSAAVAGPPLRFQSPITDVKCLDDVRYQRSEFVIDGRHA